jgi:Trk K+ transport system NAD-binding subunit
MRLVIAGAGGTTRDLLGRLGERWEVAVVDIDEARLALAAQVREVDAIVGDGSSRVTLDRAGLASSDAMFAATNDDAVNLEACRIALGHGLFRVAAIAADPERLGEYRQLGVEVFSPDRLAAQSIELELEPARVTSAPFAKGKAQALEFRVAADAPANGRPLREMAAERWLVASVLRAGRLVVPHGDTVLQTGDLVTVVGSAADSSLITRAFTIRGTRFPMEFGRQVAVLVGGARDVEFAVPEAINVVRNSAAESLLLLDKAGGSEGEASRAFLDAAIEMAEGMGVRERPSAGSVSEALKTAVAEESVGVVVVPGPQRSGALGRAEFSRAIRALHDVDRPVLFAHGASSYRQIVVHASEAAEGRVATRAAIDLAAYGKVALLGVGVIPTKLIPGGEDPEAVVRALGRLREEAAAVGVGVHRKLRRGGLARLLEEESDGALIVMPWPDRGQTSAVSQLIRSGKGSVLLVPPSGAEA